MLKRTWAFFVAIAIVLALGSGCGGHKPSKALKGKFTEGNSDHEKILAAIAEAHPDLGVNLNKRQFNLSGDIEQKHLDEIVHLQLSGEFKDLSPLLHLRNLKSVRFWDVSEIPDPATLVKLNLVKLDLSGCQITNLKPLAAFTTLERLNLSGVPATDLTPVGRLTGLEELNVDGMPVAIVRPLAGLTKLKTLDLSRCFNVTEAEIEQLEKALPNIVVGSRFRALRMAELKTKIKKGDLAAMFDLAEMYAEQSSEQNFTYASKLFLRASIQGNPEALFRHGMLVLRGLDRQNHGDASSRSNSFWSGTSRGRWLEESIGYLIAAAELGHPKAQYWAGRLHHEGMRAVNAEIQADLLRSQFGLFKDQALGDHRVAGKVPHRQDVGLVSNADLTLTYAKTDSVAGYLWLHMAFLNGYKPAEKERNAIAQNLTPEENVHAREMLGRMLANQKTSAYGSTPWELRFPGETQRVYALLHFAAARGDAAAGKRKNAIAAQFTPAELIEAEQTIHQIATDKAQEHNVNARQLRHELPFDFPHNLREH